MDHDIEKRKPKKLREIREEIRDVLEGLGCPEPHIFLTHIMAGVDPRERPGRLFQLLKRCHDRREDGRPQAEDWERAWEFISSHPSLQGEFVDQQTSVGAAKDIMPYIHPKLKTVHVSGELSHLVRVVPLTDADIDRLQDRLADEF